MLATDIGRTVPTQYIRQTYVSTKKSILNSNFLSAAVSGGTPQIAIRRRCRKPMVEGVALEDAFSAVLTHRRDK